MKLWLLLAALACPAPAQEGPSAADLARLRERVNHAIDLSSPGPSRDGRELQSVSSNRRLNVASYEVPFSRPFSRVELGAGLTKTGHWAGSQRLERHWDLHAFVRVDLSRRPKKAALFIAPRLVRTEVDLGSLTPPRVELGDYGIPRTLPWPPPSPPR